MYARLKMKQIKVNPPTTPSTTIVYTSNCRESLIFLLIRNKFLVPSTQETMGYTNNTSNPKKKGALIEGSRK